MDFKNKRDAVTEALADSGCSEKLIKEFMLLKKDGRPDEQLRLLFKQRRVLLDQIHLYQRRIDCLDYLIRKMRKE